MRTTHTRISLLRLAVLYSFLPFFGLSLLINPGRITSGQGQVQTQSDPLSSQAQRVAIRQLINQVKGLPAAQANPLISYLEVARTHLEMGQKSAACSDEQNFINRANALVTSGQLTSAQVQPLIDAVSKNKATLGCSAFQTEVLDNLTRLFDEVQRRVLHPNAQGPSDAFGYTYITSTGGAPTVPFNFLDISGTGSVLGSGDDVAYTATLSQPFTFYGTSYTQLRIATNGYISTNLLDLGSDDSNDCPLPSAGTIFPLPNGRIYPFHDNLILTSPTGRILQQFFSACPRTNASGGTEPCTVFMWDNAQVLCVDPMTFDTFICGGPFDFEAILFHNTNEIRVQIGAGSPATATPTLGIQNPTATTGLTVFCNTNPSTPNPIPSNFAVSFVLCAGITCPAPITVSNTAGSCSAVVNYPAPTGNAGCGAITCTPPSGSSFNVGTTTVNCTSGTGATCSFTVTVQDTQAPTINCPTSFSVGTNSAAGRIVTYTTTATDNCSPPFAPPTVTCVPPSMSNFPIGTTTVNCTASDNSPNSPDATCSFTVTVNLVTYAITDQQACTGPGNIVTGTFTIPNTSGAAVSVTANSTLPAGLVGVPNSCSGNFVTTCTINPVTNSISYTATIPAGQTASVSFQMQIADFVTTGTQLCSDLVVTYNGPSLTIRACITANCSAVAIGNPFPATGEVSDQKAGSVLFYNLYSSSSAAPNAQNTRIAITNINPSISIAVHLFFVDGATCSIADSLVCLTPNQTASFLASDVDPGTTGYIIAVASDRRTGCPVDFNFLIGDEYVKLSSGHAANLAAEAFAALAGGVPACNALSVTTVLNFDGTSYNRAPRVVAASNIPSRANGNDTLIVLNRVGGSLAAGAATLGSLFGILYDDAENPLSFNFTAGVCQFRSSLSSSFPRTAPRFEQFIPAGRSGWAKFYSLADIGLLGAQINFNPNAATSANAFNQGHNLHKLTLTSAAQLTIPVFPPNC